MQEKRSYSRYALWFPVTVDATSSQVWAVCNDISAGGILISGSTQLQIGDVVALSFRVSPETPERKVSGRIVRVEPRDDDPRTVWPHRMAIEFIEPDATLQATFARASSRPPPAATQEPGPPPAAPQELGPPPAAPQDPGSRHD